MFRWRRGILVGCVLVGASLVGCTEENPTDSQTNNDWNVGEGDAAADASEDAAPADVGADAATDTGGQTEEGTPFSVEGLTSAPWYAVVPLAFDPANSGTVYKLTFEDDMSVAIGFYGEVSGTWAIFGEDRVRLNDLENSNEPGQPTQLVLDADLGDDDTVQGLELVVPNEDGGQPFVLRFEQQGTPEVSLDEISGNWQSEQTYSDGDGNQFRLALRVLGGTIGYGGYNGVYIEYIGGTAHVITYESGESYWFLEPPATGQPVPSLAGEIGVDEAGNTVLYAPRETEPNSDEFETITLEKVDNFSL